MALDIDDDLPETRSASNTINPIGFLHAVRRRKTLVFLGLVVGLVVGLLYYSRLSPVFESSAKILITKKNSDVLGGADARAAEKEDQVANQISMIRSPLIAKDVAANPVLDKLPTFQEKDASARVATILAGLSASRGDPKSGGGESANVLVLTFRAGNPVDCAKTLEAVLEAHKKFMASSYHSLGEETVQLIQKATNQLAVKLQKDAEAYRKFREQTLILPVAKDGDRNQVSADRSNPVEASTIQGGRETMLLRDAKIRFHLKALDQAKKLGRPPADLLAMARRFTDSAAPSGSAEPEISEGLLALEAQEKDLALKFGADYEPLQRIRARILFLQHSLPMKKGGTARGEDESALLAQHEKNLNGELENDATMLAAYDAILADQKAQFKESMINQLQDDMMHSELLRTKQLWETTVKRLTEINLIKDMEGITTLVLAEPNMGKKVAPILSTCLIFAIGAGLMVGLGLVYLAEITDRSFRGPEDVIARLGAPVIAHMPAMDFKTLITTSSGDANSTLTQSLFVYHRPKSRDAEAVRGIRTAIYFGSQSSTLKVIQFTSAQAGDGKSTLACNVAASIAQSGKRVILVEADLRRPSFASILGRKPEVGFAQVLAGTHRWQDILDPVPEIPNLDVISSVPRPDNPAELLTGPILAKTLEQMKEAYDYIIIDSPPLLPVTDPCSIAARADGVILVVQMGTNTRPNAERACSLLETVGVRVIGVVMNRMSKDGGYGYGYNYGGYGYGYNKNNYNYGGYAYRSERDYSRSDAYYEDEHRNGLDDHHNGISNTNGAT